MDLITIFKIVNPLYLIPDFYNKFYILFFLANLVILIYFLIPWIKKHKIRMSKTALFALVLIIIFHIANSIISMNPINNIADIGVQEVCQADNIFYEHRIEKFERTHGFSTIAFLLKLLLPELETYFIFTILGIICSICIILLVFFTIKRLTKSEIYSLLGCLMYILVPITVEISTTYVTGLYYSSLIILLLFLFYLTDNSKNENLKLIFYTTIFSTYFRMENTILFLPLIYYFIKYKTSVKPIDLLLGYILFIPNTLPILTHSKNHVGRGFLGFGISTLNFSIIYSMISVLSLILVLMFLVGYVALIIKNRKMQNQIIFLLVLFYHLYVVYEIFPRRYIINFLSLVLIYITFGFYSLSLFFKLELWKNIILILFILSVFALPQNMFQQIPENKHYIISQKEVGGNLQNKSVIIYSERCLANTYSRFYSNYTSVNILLDKQIYAYDSKDFIKEKNALKYDYIVFLQDWKPEKQELESAFHVNLSEQQQIGVVKIYKIEK